MRIEEFFVNYKGLNISLYYNSGIYLACDEISGEIIYIGKSKYLNTRISGHKRDERFKDAIFFCFSCEEGLLEKEKMLIAEIRPKLNIIGFKKADKTKQKAEVVIRKMEEYEKELEKADNKYREDIQEDLRSIGCESLDLMRSTLLDRLKAEAKVAKLVPLAKRIGIHYTTLWRIVRGTSGGSASSWDKIYSYYKK